LGLADALVLANRAQGTVLVVEAGVTRQGHVQAAVKRLRSAHATLIGGVLAKYRDVEVGYHYHHYDYARDRGGDAIETRATT
jgi:Mrp family chromosome partitioning ATPase